MGEEILLKDLSEIKRSHLAWRLDHKTVCGFITASRVARLSIPEFNELEIWQIFKRFDMSDHQAKIHAKKVISFELSGKDYSKSKYPQPKKLVHENTKKRDALGIDSNQLKGK